MKNQVIKEQRIKNCVIVTLRYRDSKSDIEKEYEIKIKSMLGEITKSGELKISILFDKKKIIAFAEKYFKDAESNSLELKSVMTLEYLNNGDQDRRDIYLERKYSFCDNKIKFPFNLDGNIDICCKIKNNENRIFNLNMFDDIPSIWENGF